MKKIMLFLLIPTIVVGQIFTESPADGSITITPKGLKGKVNSDAIISNVALGHAALNKNTTGKENVAIGTMTLSENLSGEGNVAVGDRALRDNQIGNLNTAIGFNTLSYNISGTFNTAVGGYALLYNETGNYNTAAGMLTFTNNKTGNHNSAFGTRALWFNASGDYNTAIGSSALDQSESGQYNTAAGYFSLFNNSSGNNNTTNGANSMRNNTTGSNNTVSGFQAGESIQTGSNNTLVGYMANTGGDYSNATAIGANSIVDASNKVRIGNDAVTVIEGQVAWSTPSDRRLKENIIYSAQLGLEFITRLKTASYNYISDATKSRHDGFIAQDVQEILEALKVSFSGLKKSQGGTYALAYSDFIMPLVNAVKEQQSMLNVQQQEIEDLKKKNDILLVGFEKLRAELTKLKTGQLTNYNK